MTTAALDGLRILDLTQPEGHMCGRVLADLGAEVIKVEPPEGDPARLEGPFAGDEANPEASLPFFFLNAGKKSVVLDLDSKDGRGALSRLAAASDGVIATSSPEWLEDRGLDYETLSRSNPGLVMASITGFGLSGPYRHFRAPSIVCAAMGGVMHLCGSPDKPPLAEPQDQPYHLASVMAAFGILLALRCRDATGLGQMVEVSCQEVQASEQHVIVNYSANENILERAGSRTPTGGGMPYGVYPTRDGYCHLVVISTPHWRSFVDWLGNPDALADAVWDNRHVRIANGDLIEEMTARFTRDRTKADLFALGQERHITVAPINRPEEFIEDPHTIARDAFETVDHPVMGACRTVRPPYRLSKTRVQPLRPAPLLGQHTNEIADRLEAYPPRPCAPDGGGALPLKGVRVLDFSQAVAGPVLTQSLAAFGAEVIKIESGAHQQRGKTRPDMDPRISLQQRVTFADMNRNKHSVAVNMSTERGRAIVRRLVSRCDIVVENFSPGVVERWGLGYERLRELREDIIMTRLPGFGLTGPYRGHVGLAAVAMGITGMYHLWSYPGDPEPAGPPVWAPDYLSAAFGCVAVMAALRRREETGEGQVVELSQVDATAFLLGAAYLDYSINGREAAPLGNGSANHAPHGVYRCRGRDAWCAIAVRGDEEWQALRLAMRSPPWAEDEALAAVEGRLARREELDRRIESWTRDFTPHQVMQILQRAGVPAGAVQDGEHLFMDPHLRDRGFVTTVDHAETGPIEYPGPCVRLSRTPGRLDWWSTIGEGHERILGGLLNMPRDEIRRLEQAGVLA